MSDMVKENRGRNQIEEKTSRVMERNLGKRSSTQRGMMLLGGGRMTKSSNAFLLHRVWV